MIPIRVWASTTLAAATVASALLYVYAGHHGKNDTTAAPQPDLYIERPRWQRFDRQGHPASLLRAQRLEQWSGEDGARLVAPQLQLGTRQWQADAADGRLYGDDRPLELRQVVLYRQPRASGPQIETGELQVSSDGSLVESGDAVVLRSGRWHFSAHGLRFDPQRQRLELFNGVRGIHE